MNPRVLRRFLCISAAVTMFGWATAAYALAPSGRATAPADSAPGAKRVPLPASFLGLAVEVHPGYVRVSEVLHLRNATTRAFAGDVHVALPRHARFVTFHGGWQQPALDGDRIRDRLTVRPGTHRLTYAYTVAGSGSIDIARDVTIPIDLLEVFTLAPAETRGGAIRSVAAATSDGRIFNRASARGVGAGPLALQVVGVPSDQRWPAPGAAAVLAVALGAGLTIAVARRRGRTS